MAAAVGRKKGSKSYQPTVTIGELLKKRQKQPIDVLSMKKAGMIAPPRLGYIDQYRLLGYKHILPPIYCQSGGEEENETTKQRKNPHKEETNVSNNNRMTRGLSFVDLASNVSSQQEEKKKDAAAKKLNHLAPLIGITKKHYSIVKQSMLDYQGPRQYRDPHRSSKVVVPMAKISMASAAMGRMDFTSGALTHTNARKTKDYMDKVVGFLKRRFDIPDEQTVKNIVSYSKSLAVPTTSVIDKNTIVAQFTEVFGITDLLLIDRICLSNMGKFTNMMDVLEYAKIICIFATPVFIYKAMFAFNVYDHDASGTLDMHEFKKLLRPCVATMSKEDIGHFLDDPEGATEKELLELISILLPLFGKTTDVRGEASINRFEWWQAVDRENMLCQCLGVCLPAQRKLEAFMEVMTTKNSRDVAHLYANERKRCLREPSLPSDESSDLYPIMLEYD